MMERAQLGMRHSIEEGIISQSVRLPTEYIAPHPKNTHDSPRVSVVSDH